jgi:tetratricopeptide (TPR) repeat protein
VSCALTSLGCAGQTRPSPSAPIADGAEAPVIAPDQFAEQARLAFATSDRGKSAKLRLAGVVKHQLGRAQVLFERGHDRAAEDVITGAMLLLQDDDALAPALRGHSEALLQGAHAAARIGDSGRAEALYRRAREFDSRAAVQADIDEHLSAIAQFGMAQSDLPLKVLGEKARHDLSFSLTEPSSKAFTTAESAVIAWIQAAVARVSSSEEPSADENDDREEALETYRAIRTGAPALMALALRHGQAQRVVTTLKEHDLSRALPEDIRRLLVEADKRNSPRAWLSLFQLLDEARRREDEPQALPAYTADAGALWAAIGLYRASPTEFEHVMPLAMLLAEFGMPEVSARVLSQAATPETPAEAVAWSVSLVMRTLLELGETEQIEAARYAFTEARPLIALLESSPSTARGSSAPHDVMAALEIRAGYPERALQLLKVATQKQAPAETWLRLAEVAKQQGQLELARQALIQVAERAQKSGDVLLEARAAELSYDIESEKMEEARAAAALELALRRTLTAYDMKLSEIPESATYRLLARILERYGRTRETRATFEQALLSSRTNAQELSITLTEMARSAFTSGDLRLARRATEAAEQFGLPSEDIVYIALWQTLLEKRMQEKRDPLPGRLLTEASDVQGWVAVLRQFALGQLDAAALGSAARTMPQRAEAGFYGALSLSAGAAQKEQLEKVARGPAIDLVEVRMAQDLLIKEGGRHSPIFPNDIELPDLTQSAAF